MEKSDKSLERVPSYGKPKGKRLSIRSMKGRRYSARDRDEQLPKSAIPRNVHRTLWGLFAEIEREFERVCTENSELHDKVEELTAKYKGLQGGDKSDPATEILQDTAYRSTVKKPSAGQLMSQKLKTTYKASTSKIVSSLKIPNQAITLDCNQVQEFSGHKDGIWEVTCSKQNLQLIATASAGGRVFFTWSGSSFSLPLIKSPGAKFVKRYRKFSRKGENKRGFDVDIYATLLGLSLDRTARVWHMESGQCLAQYIAHSGSVNSVRFHPTEQLICSGAGDGSCHVWKMALSFTDYRSKSPSALDSPNCSRPGSGDDEQDDDADAADGQHSYKIRSAILELKGHEGPVVSADWWANGKQLVTASWDRTIKLWDVENGAVLHTLEGHENELTHTCTHAVQKLIVSSSRDTTFRLWDFRLPTMHSVNVFQGHTDTVTSAVFTSKADHVVSGSDDRTVKVWDLKNMRAPLATVNLDSAVNRLSLSPTHNVIAIPHDNRQVRIFDLNGNRLARLPRRHRQGHRRMVCSASWYDDTNSKSISLVTGGFDKRAIGWTVSF